jgi:cytochrome c oxidase cbb3-type subunit 3
MTMRGLKFPVIALALCMSGYGQRAAVSALDLAAGERAFGAQCSACHGRNGEGASGPALAVPRLRRATNEDLLVQVIREGIPGTPMPASALTNAQATQIAAYVWTLGHRLQAGVSGDAHSGEEIFSGKGRCNQCHTVAGKGGAVGPDLAGIGARQDLDFLRASLLDPEASVPTSFLQVRVTMKDGRKLIGVRVNEDTFSIQIRDLSSHFYSFSKSELTDLVKEPLHSPMPSYRTLLTSSELEDLLSYLVSLGGNR